MSVALANRLDQHSLVRMLKRWIPAPLKSALRERLRRRAFGHALERLSALLPGVLPDRSLVEELSAAWGNEGYSADVSFLEEVLRRVLDSTGPILECGSGLTTILIAVVGGRIGKQVCALEHQREWHCRVVDVLEARRFTSADVRLTRLRWFGDYDWYDVPPTSLAMGFSLVVCDGPPESTRGGRFGVLPVLHDRLAPGALMLVDDANTDVGRRTIARWQESFGVSVRIHHSPDGDYAVVECSNAPRVPSHGSA